MGHMDDVIDDNAKTFTITVFTKTGDERYPRCTEIEADDRQLSFTDTNKKRHEFYGVTYHIVQE